MFCFFFSSRTQYPEEVEVQVCLICTIHNVLLHVPFPFCGYIILYMHFLPLTLSLSLISCCMYSTCTVIPHANLNQFPYSN